MESKQSHTDDKREYRTSPAQIAQDISGQLADIELKLDHIIESIKDSLHRMNLENNDREDEE